MILLDTHVLLWLDAGDSRLGVEALAVIDRALAEDRLACSAISFWEVAMLLERRRVTLRQPLGAWRIELLEAGLMEIPVDGRIGMHAVSLRNFPADPADRLIAATAALHGGELVTADEGILAWSGDLMRRDARA